MLPFQSGRPLVLDESTTGIEAVLKAHREQIGDVLNFKIGRVGGITKTKQVE